MIEKIIANWLTNSNERNYITPYCQLLLSKGHKLIYVSTHGPFERGKDIITQNPKGGIEAFQLKGGDIALKKWQSIEGEISELLTIPIQNPSISEKTKYNSWLITNGHIKDTVIDRIILKNRSNWGQKKKTKLEYQDINLLVSDFIEMYGKYFPTEPGDFKSYLELNVSDGRDFFQKEKYLTLITNSINIDLKRTNPEVKSVFAGGVILTSYILTPWVQSNNYIAQIEAWTCLATTILYVVSKHNYPKSTYEDTLKLIETSVGSCFERLLLEVKNRDHLIEGDWRPDSVVYGPRTTIVLGYLSLYWLSSKLNNRPLTQETEKELLSIMEKYDLKMRYYGESFSPLLIWYYFFNEKLGRIQAPAIIIAIVIQALIGIRDDQVTPSGIPSPYYDYEQSIRITNGLIKERLGEVFRGTSYSLKSFLEILIRRNCKKIISDYWKKISHTQYAELIPINADENLLWRVSHGKLETRFPNQTQKWLELFEDSRKIDSSKIPTALQYNLYWLPLFITVYPHRLNADLIRHIDYTINNHLFPKGLQSKQ